MRNALGDYISKKRKELGLSLREFGKLCGLSHTHIDSIEKGYDFRTGKGVTVTTETLRKIATALHADASYLFELSILEDEAAPPRKDQTEEALYTVFQHYGIIKPGEEITQEMLKVILPVARQIAQSIRENEDNK